MNQSGNEGRGLVGVAWLPGLVRQRSKVKGLEILERHVAAMRV